MDRVKYRRVTPSGGARARRAGFRQERESVTPGETLIMQCIVSGVLMVVVLIICLVDAGPAAALRGGLRQALDGASTVGELVYDVRLFGEEWLGWEPSDRQAPDRQVPERQVPERQVPERQVPERQVPAFEAPAQGLPAPPAANPPPAVNLPPATSPEYYFPLTAEDAASNPQIPGPSAVPGLWD